MYHAGHHWMHCIHNHAGQLRIDGCEDQHVDWCVCIAWNGIHPTWHVPDGIGSCAHIYDAMVGIFYD